jgi:HK97 family phage major capsid protein
MPLSAADRAARSFCCAPPWSCHIPWEDEDVTRATIASPGSTKENKNFIVNNYTATLYTLARIFDVGDQLLRRSEGAAENLVRRKLARAVGLGEDHYALNGTGTSEPFGLLTAIGASDDYVSTFSSPSDSTIAGSVAAAVATAAGALENRGAIADGVVMNTLDFWRMLRQGADTAGFWLNPNLDVNAGRALSLWGIPVRHTPNIASDTLVVGEFSSVEFYRGLGYRVDVSSEAGDRWDKNLTGFRGEEDIAFDARPAVYAGRFQRITNAVP